MAVGSVALGVLVGSAWAKGELLVEAKGFQAGAIIRDLPTRIRALYVKERPDLCTTSKRLIYNGTLYVSSDRVVPRAVAFQHNHPNVKGIQKAENELSLVFEMPQSVEVTAGAGISDCLLGPDRFPKVEKITLDGNPGRKYTLKVKYIANRPIQSSYMVYFKTSLPAGGVSKCNYYLTWKGGRQAPQPIRLESIAIPPVRPPKRMFIMPWGMTVDHVELLAPDFPEGYKSLGINMISMEYLGHWREPRKVGRTAKELKDYINLQAAVWAKAKAGGIYVCYGAGGSFFPFTANAGYGMSQWMGDPDARAIGADGKPVPGWTGGYTPCPSYRGRFYQEALKTLETSELLRRAPASLFNFDTEYYGGGARGAKICFCKRCVSGFEKWFKKKHPNVQYVDPFTIEKRTRRPVDKSWSHAGLDPGKYRVKTDYPVQYEAWVEFKIEQFGDMFAGFKEAIVKATGHVRTAPFDKIVFADWAGLYPLLLKREEGLFGPSALHGIDLGAMGGYCPPAFLTLPLWQQYLDYYYDSLAVRRIIYDSPATSGNGRSAGGYEPMPEHARYYLLEAAMNGVQGLLMFNYGGLEGKQLQLNSEVFGAFALVDDLITLGKRMRSLSIDGTRMHVRGLQIGQEYLILVGDYYVDTDRRVGTLTCPVKAAMPVYDLLTRKQIGQLTSDNPRIKLTLDGLDDRARFLYIGKNWAGRLKGEF